MSRVAPIIRVLHTLMFSLSIGHLQAQLAPENVLVIYNDPGNAGTSDGYHIHAYYASKRPGVLGFNLDDATLSPGRLNYANFETKIRNKLRTHLTDQGLTQSVRVLLLTKGIPHQIDDINVPGTGLGNSGGGILPRFFDTNLTYASVDSELTLLFHDLAANEADASADSHADNFVLNPFFQNTGSIPVSMSVATLSVVQLDQIDILNPENEVLFGHWKLSPHDPGLLYLTARLDGNSLDDVKAMIDRAQSIIIDRKRFTAVLDGNQSLLDSQEILDNDPMTDSFLAFDRAESALSNQGWQQVLLDRTNDLYLGLDGQQYLGTTPASLRRTVRDPVILLAGLGGNHSAENDQGWALTYGAGQLPHGAVLNSFESYNGRKFGGIPPHPEQTQVADWLGGGGTLALGHVWEPLSLAVAWNDPLAIQFFENGRTWVEAAWSSIQVISWQNMVLGDPLATVTSLDDVPQLTFAPIPSLSTSTVEADAVTHTVTIQSDVVVTNDLDIRLRFEGATVAADFSTNLAGFNSGTTATVTMPSGEQEISFQVSVLDDLEDEILEILTITIDESSLDTNGDGFGEAYGFVAASNATQLPIADTPFAWWHWDQLATPPPPSNGSGSDTDLDGLVEPWEYFFQTDPTASDTPGVTDALVPLNASIEGNMVTFEVPKDFPDDVCFSLESTPTLVNPAWAALVSRTGQDPWVVIGGDVSIAVESPPGPTDEITVTTNDPVRGFRRFTLKTLPSP